MGVRPHSPAELPPELDRLGDRLEAAARAQLARRRARRRSVAKGLSAVVVGIPLALAIATSDVAPSAQPVSELAQARESLASASFVLDRVPDDSAAERGTPCVMVPDCRPSP
jgi:hypothetical protein